MTERLPGPSGPLGGHIARLFAIAADGERVNAYCGLCFGVLQYATGQWATAWLAHSTSADEVFRWFLPSVHEYGIDRAFELSSACRSTSSWLGSRSSSGCRAQQMAILPTP
jgi:hypothetical protein